jgi:hypothetical protein
MKITLFVFMISVMFLPASLYANCEAGGYMIHTEATYKKTDNQVFAILKDDKIELNAIDATTALRKELVGKYLTKIAGNTCGTTSVEISGADIYDEPQLVMKFNECLKASSNDGKYILVDKKEKQILIGTPVPIKGPTLNPERVSRTKEIILTTNLKGSTPNKSIEKSDIINLDSFPVYETTLGTNFSVLTAELYVKNLEKYFKDEGYDYYGKQYQDVVNLKIGYPVLFFATGGNVTYAGDGSHCSSMPVIYRTMDLVNRELKMRDPNFKPENGGIAEPDQFPKDEAGLHDLGVLERFKVTNAFDLDGDGKVDVIEINDRFAYRLLPGMKFEVINFGMGC